MGQGRRQAGERDTCKGVGGGESSSVGEGLGQGKVETGMGGNEGGEIRQGRGRNLLMLPLASLIQILNK